MNARDVLADLVKRLNTDAGNSPYTISGLAVLLEAYRAEVVAEHGPFPMPAGDTSRPRMFTPMQVLAYDVATVIAPLEGERRAGADMVLAYIRTLAYPDTTVPRDLRPGAEAARRMIRDRQTTEDPHDSPSTTPTRSAATSPG